jgi:mycothiol synthase
MARSLSEPIPEPQLPAGFTLRTMREEDSLQCRVDMFNGSFIDHWNHHPLTAEQLEYYLSDPNYQRQRDLIAMSEDGTFAAFCYCHISAEENQRSGHAEGWIGTLGTRRGYRRLGLGRAMLLAGLRRLQDDGMSTALLGVDAQNPNGALKLYEGVGFEQIRKTILYSKEL